MRITPEDILTGGLGLVVALFVIAAVLAWISVDAPARFLALYGNAFSASRPRHGGVRGPSITHRAGEARGSVSYSGGLRACPPKK